MPTPEVLITLRTSCGCVGQRFLGSELPMRWDEEAAGETVQATFTLIDPVAHAVKEILEIDGNQWREFEDTKAETAFELCVECGRSLHQAFHLSVACGQVPAESASTDTSQPQPLTSLAKLIGAIGAAARQPNARPDAMQTLAASAAAELADLQQAIALVDKRLDELAQAPTGDDYNALWTVLTSLEADPAERRARQEALAADTLEAWASAAAKAGCTDTARGAREIALQMRLMPASLLERGPRPN